MHKSVTPEGELIWTNSTNPAASSFLKFMPLKAFNTMVSNNYNDLQNTNTLLKNIY